MAKLYGEILSSALMTFDKSFARANGQPLDSTEVYYSLAAAQEYAAGAGAYVGQKIVVVENGVVTHYSIENEAGTLKELGSKPVGDNNSIVVAEDGTVSLKGVGTLVFERDVLDEEGQPTGEKEAIQYQPLMTSAGLIWVEPSKTTVEGLATLIDALTIRVKAIEDDYLTSSSIANMATDEKVEAAVKVETDRALAAEKALGERIDGVDGKFSGYVTTGDFETFQAQNTQAIATAKSGAETTAANALAAARLEITTEIEDAVEVAQGRADDAYELAETKLDTDTYDADKVLLNSAIEAAQKTADDAQATIDAFLNSEEIEGTVDTLKEIQAELDKLGEAVDLEEQFAGKADKTVVEGIDARVTAIENAPYVKKSELNAVDAKFDSYTNTETLEELLAGKQDVIPAETYDAYGSAAAAQSAAESHADSVAATAKQEAIDAATSAADAKYATQTALGNLETALDARLDVLEAYEHDTYATKAELEAHDTAAAAKYATKEELAPVTQTANNASTAVTNLEQRFDEIVAVGGEPNAINKIQVNGSELSIENKTVNIPVPTKFSDITDDSGFDARLTKVEADVVTAQSAAEGAQAAANAAQLDVDTLEGKVGGIQTVVAGHTTSISDHTTRIVALEQADITHATEYTTLSGIVSGHTESIAKKADASVVDGISAKVSANEGDIKTLKETTIPGINSEIAKKADADKVYTKTEIDTVIGSVEEGKTVAGLIEEISATVTANDTTVKKLISDEVTRATGVESGFETRIAKMEAFWGAADDNEVIDKLAEIVNYIESDTSGAIDMAADIQKNTDAIAAINNEDTGILAIVKEYVDDSIGAIPAATADALGLVKYDNSTIKMNESNQLYVAQVSTDVLVQGNLELILNGGSATV